MALVSLLSTPYCDTSPLGMPMQIDVEAKPKYLSRQVFQQSTKQSGGVTVLNSGAIIYASRGSAADLGIV